MPPFLSVSTIVNWTNFSFSVLEESLISTLIISSFLLSINLDLPPQTRTAVSLVTENNLFSSVMDSSSLVLQEEFLSLANFYDL